MMATNFLQENLSGSRHNKQIACWLLAVCAAIFIMVVLGGVTRLTHSGLSMVEWDPIMGVLPPLNEQDWQIRFEKYMQSPEYKLNIGMDLEGFKSIFWLEYIHRLWGRTIGLIFLLPFLYFLMRRRISKAMVPRLATMFVLGGMQGLLGWYMVKSGLVSNPYVSQYRLTAHLVVAFAIYAYIFWTAMDLLWGNSGSRQNSSSGTLKRLALILTGLVGITVVSGGFMAGLKAGFAFNTFPLMNDSFVPEGIFLLDPWYLNFFENIATVQFDHRLLAEITLLCIGGLWLVSKRHELTARSRLAFRLLVTMVVVQVGLGITTLLLVVPVWLAATHQAGALLLFTLALNVNHSLRAETVSR